MTQIERHESARSTKPKAAPYHLNRAMDSELVRDAASEVLTQLAFSMGWPNVFSAMPVFKDVFSTREA